MSALWLTLSYEFMRNAVLASVLASLLCGVIGAFVVVKRLVFVSGGISHAAFAGIGLGHLLGFPPQLGAAGAAAHPVPGTAANVLAGKVTHEAVAKAFDMKWASPDSVL